jgi:hypothetical protein
MARGACTFRERDLAAAIKAVTKAGVDIGKVEVDKTGKIVIIPATAVTPAINDLDIELAEFEARHDKR